MKEKWSIIHWEDITSIESPWMSREEVDELKLKLERLRLGVLGRLNNVIDYLEGVTHENPLIAAKFKADTKRIDSAKIDAWEVHDIVAETDAKRKTLVHDLKEAADEMES